MIELTALLVVFLMIMLMPEIEELIGKYIGCAIEYIVGVLHLLFTSLISLFSDTFLIGKEMLSESAVQILMNFGGRELKLVAFSIAVTIAVWQISKTFVGYLGLNTEIEESWKIALKTVLFSFIIWYIRDICCFIIEGPVTMIRNLILAVGLGVEEGRIVTTESSKLLEVIVPNDYVTALSGNGIVFSLLKGFITIYVDLKLFSFVLSMLQKYINIIFYIMISPLVAACGVSKATDDTFKSWVKLFAGGISIQMIQIILLKILMVYGKMIGQSTAKNWSLVFVYLAVALVMDKAEEILEEFGLTGGIKFHLGMDWAKRRFMKLID